MKCDCPHPVSSHAPLKHFATAMCLEPDCDCNGSAAHPEKVIGEQIVAMVTRILTTPREPEDAARQIAQALVLHYKIEVR